ncbi:hypothetical protein C0J29_11175 [Mycobacterium paragordonae]|nr:hypothetical protein C0J29_11175 [Mycobacterium paragordonae]
MFSVLLRRRPGEFSGVAAGLMAATRAPGFAALAIAAGSDGGDPRARLRRACDRRWVRWRRPARPASPRLRSPLGPVAATRAPGFAALAIAAGSGGGDPRARLRRACDRR